MSSKVWFVNVHPVLKYIHGPKIIFTKVLIMRVKYWE